MKPTSALGSSSWAAWTKPSPARSTGTTTGCDGSAGRRSSVSGVVDAHRVGRQVRASPRRCSSVPIRSSSWRNSAFGVSRSRTRVERVGDERVVDEVDGDGHAPSVQRRAESQLSADALLGAGSA